MVQDATMSKPAQSSQLGQDEPPSDSMATACSHDAPLTERALQRHYSKAGAQCGSAARWDLCGGPLERAVPTAIISRRAPDSSESLLTYHRPEQPSVKALIDEIGQLLEGLL
jgi:hypothetical protein